MPIQRLTIACAILFGLGGCGAGTSSLSGQVTFQGKPVIYGSVVAVAKNQQSFQGAIETDGSYSIPGIPSDIGRLTITVHSPDPNPVSPRSGRANAKGVRAARERSKGESQVDEDTRGWFPIPAKYTKFDESGLSVEIDEALVTYDIDLK